jgi:hypothetical protein
MKTSRFEKILRKKLESIEPDFQEQDWLKLQASMPVNPVPSFWQNYGHWLGYTTAAATTVVMGVLYLSQSRQTDRLLQEVSQLKQSIELHVANNQLAASKIDTVYLYKTLPSEKDRNYLAAIESPNVQIDNGPILEVSAPQSETDESLNSSYDTSVSTENDRSTTHDLATDGIAENSTSKPSSGLIEHTDNVPPSSPTEPTDRRAMFSRLDLGEIHELPTPEMSSSPSYLYRKVARRMPKSSQPRNLQPAITEQKILAKNQATIQPETAKEKKRLLPQIPAWLPLRLGIGQQWESKSKSTTVWAEGIVNENFAINTGLSWGKLNDQRFSNDKVFWDKTRINFQKYNGGQLPLAIAVYNIHMQTTILQLPLNFLYRSNIDENLGFYAGFGTNLNLRTKQESSFDVRLPNGEFEQHAQRDYLKFPTLNNANLSIGIEKRWNPIVVQVDSYLSVYQRSRPFFQDPRNIGLRVKLLYAFGKAKQPD